MNFIHIVLSFFERSERNSPQQKQAGGSDNESEGVTKKKKRRIAAQSNVDLTRPSKQVKLNCDFHSGRNYLQEIKDKEGIQDSVRAFLAAEDREGFERNLKFKNKYNQKTRGI